MPKRFSIHAVNLLLVMIFLLSAGTTSAGCGSFFRGKPLESCRSFWVLESSFLGRSGDSDIRGKDGSYQIGFELGHMRNVSANTSVGGSLYGGLNEEGVFGIKGRYRHWFGQKTSLDISPGILLVGSSNKAEMRFPGFVGSVTFNYGDWVGVTLQMQALKYEKHDYLLHTIHTGTETDVYIGTRFGSYAALAWTIVIGIWIVTGPHFEFELRD